MASFGQKFLHRTRQTFFYIISIVNNKKGRGGKKGSGRGRETIFFLLGLIANQQNDKTPGYVIILSLQLTECWPALARHSECWNLIEPKFKKILSVTNISFLVHNFPASNSWTSASRCVSVRKEGAFGGGGSCHKARGISHKKEKCKLGGSHILSFYRCNYPSAVAPVAACEATLVRLC